MRYILERRVLDDGRAIDLTESEYKKIAKARQNTVTALATEEKFDILLENYFEFEQEVCSLVLRDLIFRRYKWTEFVSELHAAGRRLINFLTTARLHIDQTKHDISTIYGSDSGEVEWLKAEFSEMYDSVLGYRVMEALRNFVQHRSLPIQTMKYDKSRDPEGRTRSYGLRLLLDVETIRKAGNFKAAILDELDALGKDHNLIPFVREYVGALGDVQESLRSKINRDARGWNETVEGALSRFKEKYDSDPQGLAAVVYSSTGEVAEHVPIMTELAERREQLIMKNHLGRGFANMLNSGEIGL